MGCHGVRSSRQCIAVLGAPSTAWHKRQLSPGQQSAAHCPSFPDAGSFDVGPFSVPAGADKAKLKVGLLALLHKPNVQSLAHG